MSTKYHNKDLVMEPGHLKVEEKLSNIINALIRWFFRLVDVEIYYKSVMETVFSHLHFSRWDMGITWDSSLWKSWVVVETSTEAPEGRGLNLSKIITLWKNCNRNAALGAFSSLQRNQGDWGEAERQSEVCKDFQTLTEGRTGDRWWEDTARWCKLAQESSKGNEEETLQSTI